LNTSYGIKKEMFAILTGLTHPTVGALCKRAGNLKNAENYIFFDLILDEFMKTTYVLMR